MPDPAGRRGPGRTGRIDRTRHLEFAAALLLELIGSGAALLIGTRNWQTILTPRARPLADDVLSITGRTVDSAVTALGLVALAGVVAVLATRGLVRALIGGLVAAAGVGLIWCSITAAHAIGPARARALVEAKHSGVGVDSSVIPHITVHPAWPILSVVAGLLVALAGGWIALRGRRWAGLSARYDSPTAPSTVEAVDEVDAESARTRASASLWRALDRGDDPTSPGSDAPG